MARQLYSNNAKGRLNAGIAAGATACAVNAGQGALFPNPANGDWFMFTFIKSTGAIEVCKCTARSTDSFTTIVRAQEGTAALALDANDRVELRVTKGGMELWEQRGSVATISGNTTLLANDFPGTRRIVAAADITLPATSALLDRDYVVFKSLTTGVTRLLPQAVDNIDGLGNGVAYTIPPNQSVKIERAGPEVFNLTIKPPIGQQDLPIPVNAMTPRQTNGCSVILVSTGAAGQPDVDYMAFDGTAKEYARFQTRLPKAWDRSTITASFAWRRASGTSAANVVWGIRALAVSDNDTPAAAFGTEQTVTDDAKTTTANFSLSSTTPACTIGGSPQERDLLFFEVFRDAANPSDTLDAVDAWLSAVTLSAGFTAPTDD